MKCPNCNHENPDSNKFCAECGTKLEVNPSTMVCPNCHNQVPSDSKFCPDCGTKIFVSGCADSHCKNETYSQPSKATTSNETLSALINDLKNKERTYEELCQLINSAKAIDTVEMDIDKDFFLDGRIIFNGFELGVTKIDEISNKGYFIYYDESRNRFEIVIGSYRLFADINGLLVGFRGLMPLFFYDFGCDFGSSPEELYNHLETSCTYWHFHEELDEDEEFDEGESFVWNCTSDVIKENQIVKLYAYVYDRDLNVYIVVCQDDIL